MASLIKKQDFSISLFPMFNILVCTLGVLIFIMSTIAVVSLGKGKSLKIVAEGLRGEHDKLPHYLVWDGISLIMLEKKDTVLLDIDIKKFKTYKELNFVIAEKIADSQIGKLFQEVKQHSKTEYIVIIVRASGFDSFTWLHKYIKSEGIDIGYEPMDNESKIKL